MTQNFSHIRLSVWILAMAVLLAVTGAGNLYAKIENPVVALAVNGDLDSLARGVASGTWGGTVSDDLARALLTRNGLDAAGAFERITRRADASDEIKALAWFHLYGYDRLVADHGGADEALREIRKVPELATALFPEGVPDEAPHFTAPESVAPTKAPTGDWAVQIGAFSARANAQRLADKQARKGYTAEVVPIRSGKRTLFAVWIGHFPSRDAASDFGRRTYGSEGKDFRTVSR